MPRLGRPVATALVALVVGLSLVVADPRAPAAMAWATPPPPIAYPGPVLTAVNNVGGNAFDATTWNKTLTNGPSSLPTGGATSWGGKVGILGSAAGAALLGLEIGTGVAGVMGLSTSGDFFCDAATLIGGSTCAYGPVPTYLPNGDIDVPPPGWALGDNAAPTTWLTPWGSNAGPGTVTVDVLSAPAYQVGGQLRFRVGFSGAQPADADRIWLRLSAVGTGGSWYGPLAPTTIEVVTFAAEHQGFRLTDDAGVTQARWYPQGHPDRPADVDPDPQRWWRTTWLCSEGAGGAALSAAFSESAVEWPGFPTAQCSAGAVTHVLIEQLTDGGGTTTMYEWAAPPEWVTFATDPATDECVGGGCVLLLERLDPTTGAWLSCFSNPSLCTDWFADPAKAEKFQCLYNGAVRPLAECNVYAPTFKAKDPTYADPETGAPPVPQTPPAPGGETDAASCPPPFTWTSLVNPWWYFKASTCAMEWAVVPGPGVVAGQVDRLQDGLSTRAPFSVVVAIPGLVGSIGEGFTGGCTALPDFSTIEGHPLRLPCEPPASVGFTMAYTLMTIMLWTGVVLAIWRMAHQAVGGKG